MGIGDRDRRVTKRSHFCYNTHLLAKSSEYRSKLSFLQRNLEQKIRRLEKILPHQICSIDTYLSFR